MEKNLIHQGITKKNVWVIHSTPGHFITIHTSNSRFSTGSQKESGDFSFVVGGIFEFSTYQQP